MEFTYDSSDLAREEILIGALNKLSPTDVIKSKELATCFREFLGRGTTGDCLQLFPEPYKAALSALSSLTIVPPKSPLNVDGIPSSSGPSSCGTLEETSLSTAPASKPPSSCSSLSNSIPPITTSSRAGAQTSITQPQPTADASLSNPGNSVVKYFQEKRLHSDRIERLGQYILSFVNAKPLPPKSYENLWSDKGNIFASSEDGLSRMCRLRRGRLKIEEGMSQYKIADRFCLMFSVIDVAHYALTATRAELGLRKSRRRMTAALEKVAMENKIPIKDLHQEKRKSRNYFELLFGPGPGSLLETGAEAASFEFNTNTEDVKLVSEYIETHLPTLYAHLISLNGVGARTMVIGLLAYGWTPEEVKSSPTPHIKAITKHLDGNLMVKDGTPTTQHSNDVDRSSEKGSGDDIRVDERKLEEDHPHKLYTSNQSSFTFGNHTTETSLPPDDIGVENQRPSSCNSIAADSNPSSEMRLEQPAVTDASADDIPGGAITSNAERHIENDGMFSSTENSEICGWTGYVTSAFGPDSTQQSAPTHDPTMLGYVDVADYLSNSFGSDSTQQAAPTHDPTMLGHADVADYLSNSFGSDSTQQAALTIDPSMLDMTSRPAGIMV